MPYPVKLIACYLLTIFLVGLIAYSIAPLGQALNVVSAITMVYLTFEIGQWLLGRKTFQAAIARTNDSR